VNEQEDKKEEKKKEAGREGKKEEQLCTIAILYKGIMSNGPKPQGQEKK